MNAAPQLLSTETFARKTDLYPHRNGEQSPPLRVANLLPETVNCSRWWAQDLRRVCSLVFSAVVVGLLVPGTMGRRARGWCLDDPTVSMSLSGAELGDVGPDRIALPQNSTHGGRRTTGLQDARSNSSPVDLSGSPSVEFQYSVTVSKPPAAVPKTHVSDIFRLVFVAGVEGTGHHYIKEAMNSMYADSSDLPRGDGKNIGVHKYYAPNVMGGEEAKKFSLTSRQATENMRQLAEWAATLSSPGTLEFFAMASSYPLNAGPLKVMQYMDLRAMAETAEGEGIDFRVLYLRRSAKDLVIANTVHRKLHFGMGHGARTLGEEEIFMEYMRVLFTDIAVLQSFLSEIGQEFIVCHDWDRLGGKEQASTIATFISPSNEIAGLVESSLVQTAKKSSSTDALPFEDADAVVARLQRKLDVFEPLYCG
ncbi:unnamed protein product [Ectocarpus fasciculatus]